MHPRSCNLPFTAPPTNTRVLALHSLQAVRTRSNLQCLEKWYDQLCPSMVDRGEWGPGDDRRLLRALYRRRALL